MRRVLFIVKYREDSAGRCAYDGTPNCFGGLYNSATFVVEMLVANGIRAKLVQVCDNNGIDAEVHRYRPDVVVIEALWVVPEKFAVLQRLHPRVKWIVRCHSEIPFLAHEGVAMEWLPRYIAHKNVAIANNSLYGTRDFMSIASAVNPEWEERELHSKVQFLPNWYPALQVRNKKFPNGTLDIGCFGAIRPLKNQLIQALAAVEFARRKNKPLRFHMNTRTEQGGEAILKNIRSLMDATGNELVEYSWQQRPEFLQTMSTMDASLQVSFSETFDITAADSVRVGVPLVTSREVVWAAPESQADTTNTACIVARLEAVTGPQSHRIASTNLMRLVIYGRHSESVWIERLES